MYKYSYKNLQNALHESIILLDHDKFKKTLADGSTINNDNCKNNTLNCAIRAMLSYHSNKFDLSFIKMLMDSGAKISQSNELNTNTLSLTLKYYSNYVSKGTTQKSKKIYRTNIMDLILLLIDRGAIPSNSSENDDTLSICISTKDLDLIEIIEKLNPEPNTHTFNTAVKTQNLEIIKNIYRFGARPNCSERDNTLNLAILLENLEIIQYVCAHGALPCNFIGHCNTLERAVLTGNPEIIKEIIVVGGQCVSRGAFDSNQLLVHFNGIKLAERNEIFENFENKFLRKHCAIDNNVFNQILNLIMCIGLWIPDRYVKQLMSNTNINKNKARVEIIEKILNYNKILKVKKIRDIDEKEKIKSLLHELKDIKDKLLEKFHDKKNRILEMHRSIETMPSCCIDIIYEYQRKNPLMRIIDWIEFGQKFFHL